MPCRASVRSFPPLLHLFRLRQAARGEHMPSSPSAPSAPTASAKPALAAGISRHSSIALLDQLPTHVPTPSPTRKASRGGDQSPAAGIGRRSSRALLDLLPSHVPTPHHPRSAGGGGNQSPADGINRRSSRALLDQLPTPSPTRTAGGGGDPPSTLSRRPSMDARLKLEAAKRDSPAEVTPPLVEAAAPVEAEPTAKHVPSMPQRKHSLDVRLQESVKSEEGRPPAVAAPLEERAAAEVPVAAKAPATLSRRPSMDARLKLAAAKRDSPAEVTEALEAAAPVEAADAGDAVGAAVAALAARICANVVREASGAGEAAGAPRLSA